MIQSNMNKIYRLILVKCADAIHSVINKEEEYDENSDSYELIWILNTVKNVFSVVESNTTLKKNMSFF